MMDFDYFSYSKPGLSHESKLPDPDSVSRAVRLYV
jgi:hypothetical protein